MNAPDHEARATADLIDRHGDEIQSCDLQMRDLGGHVRFEGTIVTLHSPEDNLLLKQIVEERGVGRVIVVDAGGSLHRAMLGDQVAATAERNGWSGIVVNGAVRDSRALSTLPLGIKALGTNPRRSLKHGHGTRDVEVAFGGTMFRPGDHLTADEDGIVVLPRTAG